ncbi:hypothetical protein FisN_31Lh019 [Fistulifera solaris]|uniref:Uncharacterized protein n=1 Tax=Fistulifera solaris TaxID=1519565 RepID=A0A1Z5K665_FISSO|nr:hypothetical protein FisN_31Lh019 [Fistulifera solaris]|eukprot:GAX21734.1 hypothetical protein FisN_31Lh019 [Fistulifera solaris]
MPFALRVFLLTLLGVTCHATDLFGGDDRETIGTFVTTCFNQLTTRTLDSGGELSFRLNQREWQVFEVFQPADIGCDCTLSCLDPNARVDLYVTFERRARLDDNWDGWACKETTAQNPQICKALVEEPDSVCRIAVHGYLFERRSSECTLTCSVDAASCRGNSC